MRRGGCRVGRQRGVIFVMERSKAFVLVGGALAVVAGLWVVFGGNGQDQVVQARAATADGAAGERADADGLAGTELAAVAPPGLDSARPTDCLIEPSQVVRVNSGVEGVIQAIYVERGDDVRRGQVVAQLRDDLERPAAAAAQAPASNVHTVQADESRAAYLGSVRQRNEQISEYLARDAVEEAQANARSACEERQAAAENQRV